MAWWRLAILRLAAARTSPGVAAAAKAREAYGAAFGCIRERIKQDLGRCSGSALDRLTALGSQAETLAGTQHLRTGRVGSGTRPEPSGREGLGGCLRCHGRGCQVDLRPPLAPLGARCVGDPSTGFVHPPGRLHPRSQGVARLWSLARPGDSGTHQAPPSEEAGVLVPDAQVVAGAWSRVHGSTGPPAPT